LRAGSRREHPRLGGALSLSRGQDRGAGGTRREPVLPRRRPRRAPAGACRDEGESPGAEVDLRAVDAHRALVPGERLRRGRRRIGVRAQAVAPRARESEPSYARMRRAMAAGPGDPPRKWAMRPSRLLPVAFALAAASLPAFSQSSDARALEAFEVVRSVLQH